MKNKKLISSVIALVLALIGAVFAGVTHNSATAPADTRASVKGSTYTYNIPDTTEFSDYYSFRTKSTLSDHYKKHKADTQTSSKEEYLYRANYVINNEESLHKTEKEDGDYIYYLAETNELVILSRDGYIRTYFCPENGKKYYDKQ